MEEQIRIYKYSNYPIPYLDLDGYEVDTNLKSILSKQEWQKMKGVPVDLIGEKILTVCLENPSLETIELLQQKTGKIVRIFHSSKEKIQRFLTNLFTAESKVYPEVNWKN